MTFGPFELYEKEILAMMKGVSGILFKGCEFHTKYTSLYLASYREVLDSVVKLSKLSSSTHIFIAYWGLWVYAALHVHSE